MFMPKTYTQDEVLAAIRKVVDESSLRQTAERIGVSAGYLSDVLNSNRAVSDAIADAFGFEREIVTEIIFRKKAA